MRRALVIATFVTACGGGSSSQPDAAFADAPPDAAPAVLPDLRFKWVGAAPSFMQSVITNVGYLGGSGIGQIHDQMQYAWSPLQLTLTGLIAGSYSWDVADFTPEAEIEPLRAVAQTGKIATLDADLAAEITRDGVLVSIDILPDAYAFVTAAPDSASPTYTMTSTDVTRAGLDAWVASQAATGSVVTALSVSPTAGEVRAYAFAKAGDTTGYDTQVVDVTGATLLAQAQAMASAAYVITAFGRIGDNAAVMVGTRAPGGTARAIALQAMPDLRAGDAVVAWLFEMPHDVVIVER